MIDKLLTPSELSGVLDVPIATLYKWRHQGKGPPAVRIGRHLRYHPDDVADWIREQQSSRVR